jgi:hypothetical protein
MQNFDSPYLIHILGNFKLDNGREVLILEQAKGKRVFEKEGVYDVGMAMKIRIFRDILMALRYMHLTGI